MPQPKNGKATTLKKKPISKLSKPTKPAETSKTSPKNKIFQKLFTYTNQQGIVVKLTAKQYKFCMEYLSNKGLGIEAVIEAGYECYYPNSKVINRKAAASVAYENLMKPYINDFLNLQLAKFGFSDENVELQHLMLIHQNSDLATKKGAIDMYYKLKNKYPNTKVDVNLTFDAVEIESFGKNKTEEADKKL